MVIRIHKMNYTRFIHNWLLSRYAGIPYPLNAQIELTARCNLQCKFCGITQNKDVYKDREMITEEIKRIVDQLVDLKITTISVTGGEPLLRKDCGEVISYIKKKGCIAALATNGWFLKERLQSGDLNDLEYVMVSLDSVNPERHDAYRGVKGSWARAVEGIKEARSRHITTIISSVITPENFYEMEDLARFARELGCAIEIMPCEDIVREENGKTFRAPEIHKQHWIPSLRQWGRQIRYLTPGNPNLITDYFTARIVEEGGFGHTTFHCNVAQAYIFIRYNGEGNWPCKLHPIMRVNLLKHPLDKVYRSKQIQDIMKKSDSYPFCKGCRLGCAIVATLTTKVISTMQKFAVWGFRWYIKQESW
jgi:MoaA/NifB/PqqE/SkfB family radical SAM enzyme